MAHHENQTNCNDKRGICSLDSDTDDQKQKKRKPLEIYTFIDPLCPECWAFEPILKKLQVEYGQYFRIRFIVAGKLEAWNLCRGKYKGAQSREDLAHVWRKITETFGMPCDGDVWLEDPITSSYTPSLAIKAAELQGPQAGVRFLRKLREHLFLNKQNVTKEDILISCAQRAGLDVKEFKQDLHSKGAAKALRCDMQTTKEMDVDLVPTFVFFNDNVDEEGIKVTGHYPYHIYVQILEDMLGFKPERQPPMSLEHFLKKYEFVASIEVAVVFDLEIDEAEKQLKKLVLKQKLELVPMKYGNFWRYLE
ncbi:ClpXP adapter SpxH family protein [Halalkalibacterium halodurans]|uniref:ClpXP adapter SpxH family protein n=1 Tax=Halalkalibacterium halodurans TaxID=86665 RepID=UPI002E251633|nr:ClpXP adapter SpxH family protein [Halalkalibacterium halodurans]MED4085219.1 ClpXP adapter SpxH family protein [Halalkalibacterium halodurans]MED4104191.1 ClpXP adapter SpxH family protein [Halalkalibacterium halodurans]MED4110491.1 ClpXP adapter SpxH family protein [Halalkalibacterium halodurans]MED4148503.1 ClpXP adapter SpxH family protein [Halalkalibacterium halodurans]